jgi:hypothetical protein
MLEQCRHVGPEARYLLLRTYSLRMVDMPVIAHSRPLSPDKDQVQEGISTLAFVRTASIEGQVPDSKIWCGIGLMKPNRSV